MPIDYAKLKSWPVPDIVQTYDVRDTILYALGVGCGGDPMDRADLAYVYEEAIKVLPSMGVVLGYPGFWLKDPATGIDWRKVLHGEQGVIIHAPLPAAATVVGKSRITEIVDKGKDALLFSERDVIDQATGQLLCTLTSTTFLRGEGGFGGPTGPTPQPHSLPDRAPDLTVDTPTVPQAALIYRLSGDYNPLHADPDIATAAGFRQPILHGLASFGVACRALLRACCNDEPANLKEMKLRFSSPVYPGETIRTEIWRDGKAVSFRARVVERDLVVLNNGFAQLD
ncbi:3-alpha,7-alpha,12-alpha-trihydroxy-5-beta-cholest-24-enoyl-CoA hydratase [Phreatobacter aquaticus]|uniref:3-alpha,7-alpha, 12-alpha-trihydroxy-5-beta-cholest-24-enoyl-CoA hydratase n=1 Tax=Phreatobacter aquaticus TaxID=2570229 RepID=A0A4D7QIJ2_9HYPH|nr:MaoC/PaaZ C-terminal domain-containing protein [Phreatobacter aquaticus]QCK85593.1 3-alpha,7-alpha,12-alpha-trihydroxy-5-beta-cholest-24-enoyl-CoA hydratase [Phreatobacter aquaticus]